MVDYYVHDRFIRRRSDEEEKLGLYSAADRLDRYEGLIKKLEADLEVLKETVEKLKEIRNQEDLHLSELDSTEALGELFNYIELTAKQALEMIGKGNQ